MAEPTRLGRYQIESVLGKGAMGVVYLARDPVIGRRVALKTLSIPADAEEAEEFRQRFLREAQAAGLLTHPGIVTVFDAGVDDSTGLSFIAMEFVEGRSLREFLRSGQVFAFSEVARIGAALAVALDYAHGKGVVHRDIKPANILLTPQGTAKITDFGVARLESSNLTATGQFIGTPNYMSPEQVAGGVVDGRSDLFSLGVVLFELLTGQRPFPGHSLTEVAYKIVHEPARIPSQVRPGLPSAFNPIVLKLLEKDPARRYARGADIGRALEALRRVLAGVTGDAGSFSPSTPPPASREPRPESVLPTATRATVASGVPAAAEAGRAGGDPTPDLWHRPIAPRWIAMLLAAAAAPPALLVAVLAARVDRGPYGGPAPGEVVRRHRLAAAQRRAALAVAAGDPAQALAVLPEVFEQAPYSAVARALRAQALAEQSNQASVAQRAREAAALREEGKALLKAGRWRAAEDRFQRALALGGDDGTTRDFLDLAREHQLVHRPQPAQAATAAPVPAAARPEAAGNAALDLYFNSPLSDGVVTVAVDGQVIAEKRFDFRTRGFFGIIKKKGSGVIEDSFKVKAGEHAVVVLLADGSGKLLGEQTLPASFQGGARYALKIEMDGEQSVPRFSLTAVRGR